MMPALIKPRALPRNPHFAVLATSSPSEMHRIREAAFHLEAQGATVTLAPNIDHHHRGYLAGSDEERAEQFNHYMRSEQYDAFLFARGGYGAMRILESLDYDVIRRNRRPIIGFSDVTAIHQAMALHSGLASFHGPMMNLDFHDTLSPHNDSWFWSMLRGEAPLTYRFKESDVLFAGDAEGTLFGGCLSLTAALVGTRYDYWIDDGIWFWEDVEEPVYRIDRMLTHLRLSGRMQRIRGVVIGRLKGCGGEAEMTALLQEFFASSGIPVVRNFPFGHYGDNLLMPIGAPVRLSTSDRMFTITDAVVER